MATSTHREPGPGAKTMFLIRRRGATSRDALVAHWFANHMPGVIASQESLAAQGRPHAWRYLVTLFRPDGDAAPAWDGVAPLWWDRPLPRPRVPFGEPPRDDFQARAEPYLPWPTREYVIIDGADRLPVRPLAFGPPFPTTRTGFHKVTFLVKTRAGTDFERFYAHWLGVHVPNAETAMAAVGGFRYVVSRSLAPTEERYAGMAELYFPDAPAWHGFRERLRPDGIEQWLDLAGTCTLTSDTEFVGIP